MTQEGGAVLSLVSSQESRDLAQQDDQNDPNKITKHHRKLKSDGGGNHRGNISDVPLFKHRAWHALYQDEEPEVIDLMFRQDYEVFGIDFVKSPLMTELHQKWANKQQGKDQKAGGVAYPLHLQGPGGNRPQDAAGNCS